jgi:hypothetical protein
MLTRYLTRELLPHIPVEPLVLLVDQYCGLQQLFNWIRHIYQTIPTNSALAKKHLDVWLDRLTLEQQWVWSQAMRDYVDENISSDKQQCLRPASQISLFDKNALWITYGQPSCVNGIIYLNTCQVCCGLLTYSPAMVLEEKITESKSNIYKIPFPSEWDSIFEKYCRSCYNKCFCHYKGRAHETAIVRTFPDVQVRFRQCHLCLDLLCQEHDFPKLEHGELGTICKNCIAWCCAQKKKTALF